MKSKSDFLEFCLNSLRQELETKALLAADSPLASTLLNNISMYIGELIKKANEEYPNG